MSANIGHDDLDIFFETSQDPMCIITFDGNVIKSNHKFKSLFGYAQSIVPYCIFDVVHNDDMPAFQLQLEALSVGKKTINFSVRCAVEDGSYIWIDWNASAKDKHIYSIGRDVTLCKKKEQDLQSVANRLTLATRSAEIGVWEFDITNNKLIWDDKMYELYGVTRDTFISTYQDWMTLLHPDDRLLYETELNKAIHGSNKTFSCKFRINIKERVYHIRSFVSVHQAYNGHTKTCAIGVNWDITKEIEIERIRGICEAVVRDTSDAIITTTCDTIITSWNQGAQKLYGYTEQDSIGKTLDFFIPKEYSDLSKVLSGTSVEYRDEIVRKDQRHVHVFSVISPLKDSTSKIIGISMISRDITKDIEIDRIKSEYISLTSHQLRSPLANIKSLCSLLLTDENILNIEHLQYIKYIHASTEEMFDLIDSLLGITYLESGHITVNIAPLDITAFALEVQEELSFSFSSKLQTCSIDHNIKESIVYTDPLLLKQIFINLLSNSNKYTPVGGCITINVNMSNDRCLISVSDNGYGIPDGEKSKIFTKFYRASNIINVAEGNGLGLYLVKKIVESFGGNIWFENANNVGTTFYVDLPVRMTWINM